jgi:Fe2+ transport system protein FeoA
MTLSDLPISRTARITEVSIQGQASNGLEALKIVEQLQDIGFIPGEMVVVLKRSIFGGDPIVVSVGKSRFALRLSEARYVQVIDDDNDKKMQG